jgi:flap endonuclease-1
MGIKGLTQLLGDHAPGSIRETEMKHLFGRKVAVDASMSLYQFVIAIMGAGDDQGGFGAGLTDDQGETTSHLQGMFHRTIRMMANGVKPVLVFDGKPPSMKKGELAKRQEAKEQVSGPFLFPCLFHNDVFILR